jgi:hypothetical protein
MYVRQCTQCGVIDPRESFPDEDAAQMGGADWSCVQCGSTQFEPVVMTEADVVDPVDDLYQ